MKPSSWLVVPFVPENGSVEVFFSRSKMNLIVLLTTVMYISYDSSRNQAIFLMGKKQNQS